MVSSFGFAPFVFLLLVIGGTARPLYPLPGKGDGGSKRPLQTFRPYNIAHRGSNGEIPEETRQAYLRAIEEGADFIETDILSSKDGVLICFHDVTLDETTDIANYKEFANRKRTYEVQGVNMTGFFTVDFTLKELKSLRVNQRFSFRDQQYNGKFQIITFEEFINIALDAPRVVGIYPEIKNPVLINQYVKWSDGKKFEDKFVETLKKYGYKGSYLSKDWLKQPVFIQSFAPTSLVYISNQTELPKLFLIDDVDIPTQDTNQSYWEITSDTYLDYIKQYVIGIGPWKDTIVPVTKNYVTNPSDLVERAHARNLQVHPYTYRNENQYLHFNFSQDPYKEYDYWINKIGVDDDESLSSASINSGLASKKGYIPRRLVIGNDEYVRIGNGNQLIRDPKKRTRKLANEKVRWSLHTARQRLARKQKYCQFFTRFGKCNKDDGGKCPYIHDPSKIAVCTKFLKGLCSTPNCKLTHKVIPERMPDCSYFLQGLCSNESCPYRHVNVNPKASICDGFLKGYCADGNECRKKHSYVCPSFEATGTCTQGTKCKLHHPKKQSKGKKRKRSDDQNNGRGRYFGSIPADVSEPWIMVAPKFPQQDEEHESELTDYISLDAYEEDEDAADQSFELSTYCDNDTTDLQLDTSDELIKPVSIIKKFGLQSQSRSLQA